MAYEQTCTLGAPASAADLAIWGDSQGAELSLAIGNLLSSEDRALRQITASACPPVVGVDFPERPDCRQSNETILRALVSDPAIREVVMVMNVPRYLIKGMDEDELLEAYSIIHQALRNAGKRVLLVMPMPNINMDAASLAGYAVNSGLNPRLIGRPRQDVLEETAEWRAAQIRMAEDDQETGVYDPLPLLCNAFLCPIVDSDGQVLYFNETHISMTGARILASDLGTQRKWFGPSERRVPGIAAVPNETPHAPSNLGSRGRSWNLDS